MRLTEAGPPEERPRGPKAAPPPCPECGGTGFRIVDDAASRRSYASACECRRRGRTETLLKQARIPRRYEACDFAGFWRGPEFDPSLERAYKITAEFVAGYSARKLQQDAEFGLLFLGPPGVGKTHLAVAALRTLILDQGVGGLFADFREIIKTIQASYNPVSGTSEMEVLRPLLQAEILLLDDLGVCRMTEWVRDMVGHIISTRYNERRVTLITTNLEDEPADSRAVKRRPAASRSGQDDLAARVAARPSLADRVGPEVRSRLHEMCEVVVLKDEDYRMRVGRHGRR